jgi:hypothetical protein
MSMGTSKQVVRPPQRGIFPLDHGGQCSEPMQLYLECLDTHKSRHHECQLESKSYLTCRMEQGLMSKENLDQLGYGNKVEGAREYGKEKEKAGFIAGKHIHKKNKWFWERSGSNNWTG